MDNAKHCPKRTIELLHPLCYQVDRVVAGLGHLGPKTGVGGVCQHNRVEFEMTKMIQSNVYKMAALILVAGVAVGCADEVDDVDFRRSEAEVIIENLELAGFPRSEIGVLADGTVYVGDDAVVTLQASREMIGHVDNLDAGVDADFRQYHTNNLINTNVVQNICVKRTSGFEGSTGLNAALDQAVANYNAQGLSFSMEVRTSQQNTTGCDATITAYFNQNSGGGVAGFPSGGYPYSQLTVGPIAQWYGVPVATHVIQHELGHCIGFRHTDYFNRSISCGGGAQNEGDGGVGANHIPGTPTTNVSSTTSVMNSCYSQNSNGVWTSSDEVALAYLYEGQGQGPASWELVQTQSNLSGGVLSFQYDATNYDAIQFTMSGGTGDADLYVRFGAAPTAQAWDCRPYIAGNNEICTFNPSQSGTYYVMIDDYQAYSGVTLTVEKQGGGAPEPEPEPGDWQELIAEDFEGGLGSFNDGGSDARWLSDANYAYSGSGSAEIRDNSGTASSVFSDSFNLLGRTELEIEFFFYARSMENGENFFVELWNGGSWVTVANFVAGSSFANNGFYTTTIPVGSGDVNFSNQAQVRFRCDASNDSDWIYVDDVTIRAR